MSYYFIKIFVHLPVIAAVCYFSVYKVIGWNTTNIYLFKVNSRNTRRTYEKYPKLTIKTIESNSGFFTVQCFYC